MCDICRPAGQRAWYGERSDVGVGCVSSATSIRPADEKLTLSLSTSFENARRD
jgi:hypothetical protein